MRINRYIAASGLCSRRMADKLVTEGKVMLNGRTALLGDEVGPRDRVTVDGKAIRPVPKGEQVYMAFHKPTKVTTTTDARRRDNIIDYIGYGKRIFPIGRLDRDSEGLILLTNDGDIVNRILRAQNGHEKEYEVTVNNIPTPDQLEQIRHGILLDGKVTLPTRVRLVGPQSFRIILKQGLNRQIRRMCEAVGLTVTRLVRLRIMHINLGNLKAGEYRLLTKKETRDLMELLRDSTNETLAPPPRTRT